MIHISALQHLTGCPCEKGPTAPIFASIDSEWQAAWCEKWELRTSQKPTWMPLMRSPMPPQCPPAAVHCQRTISGTHGVPRRCASVQSHTAVVWRAR